MTKKKSTPSRKVKPNAKPVAKRKPTSKTKPKSKPAAKRKPTAKVKPAAKSKAKPKAKIVAPKKARPKTVKAKTVRSTSKAAQPRQRSNKGIEEAVSPNFTYSFDLTNMRILHLIVGETRIDAPASSGSFFARIMDPNNPPMIRMIVVATSSNPGPSGTLTMKFRNKTVFDPAKNIPMGAASGGFDENITLPS